jgi:hypothetical protein
MWKRSATSLFIDLSFGIFQITHTPLSVQADKPVGEFFRYYVSLIRLGFGRQPLFHAYFFAILLLGTQPMERMIAWIKGKLGHTPVIGSVYKGNDKHK